VTISFAQRQQVLREKIARASTSVEELEARLRELDERLGELTCERQKYQLLQTICDSLEQLRGLGGSPLLWGDAAPGIDEDAVLRQGRLAFAGFSERLLEAEQARAGVAGDLEQGRALVDDLEYELAVVREDEENARFEFVVDRDQVRHSFRPAVMPWSAREEDRRRQRKVLLFAFLAMFVVGLVPQVWKLPPPDRSKPVPVPDRLVQMVKKKEPPKPVEKPKVTPQEKPEEKIARKEEQKPVPKEQATPVEKQQARARAESKGVLAFKESFSDLIDDAVPSNLGADARVSNAGRQSLGGSVGNGAAGTRSLIVSQAGGGSGGIANAGISRGGVGSGSGNAIAGSGMATGRAHSSIGTDVKEAGRPLTKGAGPARTDEEIQIVFDRYKSALYRIYNRELRNDPTLRGKMVLALTIEPDGRVSACRVQSTDMDSAALSADIVERVLKFNFGEKAGVPTTKILYPIDFLPAS
jgi:outer membrane biosynthesis protein TonB